MPLLPARHEDALSPRDQSSAISAYLERHMEHQVKFDGDVEIVTSLQLPDDPWNRGGPLHNSTWSGLLPHNVHASVYIASCVTFVYAVCNIFCVSRVQTLVVCISCRRR